jgi:hypothetical protein
MSESKNRQEPPFSFEFNRSIKVRKESPAITSNAGVLLLREVEDKLAVIDSLAKALHDPRDQNYIRYSLSELLRERVFAFALGYARQDDADTLAHDPAFRLAVWDRLGTQLVDERLASQPTASRAMDIFSRWHNREAIRQHLFTPILRHQRQGSDGQKVRLGVVDIDGFPIETHGGQPGAVYNGYYRKTIYSPLTACFSANGTFDAKRLGEGFIHTMLRDGNAAPAEGALLFIDDVIDKAEQLARTTAIRIDAGFASAEILNRIDERGARFTVRLPHNPALERVAAPFITRPVGRPPKDGYEFALELDGYQNPEWNKPYRVILVVVDKPDQNGRLPLFPHYFFIATNWPKDRFSAYELLEHYRQRGTFEDRLGEWNALGVNLSQSDFAKNEVTMLLSMLAFNLLEVLRGEMESAADPRRNPPYTPESSGFDMKRLRDVILKVGAVVIRGGRRLCLDIADGMAPLWMALLKQVGKLTRYTKRNAMPVNSCFTPPPTHAFNRFTPRM